LKTWLRFPPPLHVLVLLFVLACGAISVLFKVLVMDGWRIERIVEEETRETQGLVDRLAVAVTTQDPTSPQPMARAVAIVRETQLVRWAVVCDAQGKIVHATRPKWNGKTLSQVAPAQASVLTSLVSKSREPAHLTDERDSITAARAVPASADAPLQYVVLAERDLSRRMARVMNNVHRETLIYCVMLLAYSLLLWFALFTFLRWRIRDFYRKTGLAKRGKTPFALLHGGDEFAEIAGVLGEAENLLQDVGENLQEVVWIVTPELRPVYLSPAFERIHMRKREEAYGNGGQMPDYILKEYHDAVRDAFVGVVRGASSLHLEYRIQRGDGQIRWVETSGCPVRDANGGLQRIVGITRDITEQKALQEELVNVSDQERYSLGHDLHDDACQRLAAMKMKCEALATRLEDQDSPHSEIAAELTDEIADTSMLLRNIARGLAPVEVEGNGLMHALHKLGLMQEAIHEVPVFFDAEHTVIVENEVVATHLYRIAQELITNAARHAKPERIDVKLQTLPGAVRIVVMNDGKPFQKPAPNHGGMGLKIIRYRASAIGATVEIRPRTDGITGTIAECTVGQDTCLSTTLPGRDGDSAKKNDHAVPGIRRELHMKS
jgi:PAS domain S-box-containing protein